MKAGFFFLPDLSRAGTGASAEVPCKYSRGSGAVELSLSHSHSHSLSLSNPVCGLRGPCLPSRSSSAVVQGLRPKSTTTMRSAGLAKFPLPRQARKVKPLSADLATLLLRLPAQILPATPGQNRPCSQQDYVMKTRPGPPQRVRKDGTCRRLLCGDQDDVPRHNPRGPGASSIGL